MLGWRRRMTTWSTQINDQIQITFFTASNYGNRLLDARENIFHNGTTFIQDQFWLYTACSQNLDYGWC